MNKKIIIISGGSGFLGKEVSKSLYNIDTNYIIVFDKGVDCDFKKYSDEHYNVDITDENGDQGVYDAVKEVYNIHRKIDVAINMAAINSIPEKNVDNSFENYSLEKWKRTLDVNLTGAFLLSRECIKYMLKNENREGFKGTVVNVASDLGVITSDQSVYDNGYIKPPDYGVSKAGLIHLTKYIAGYYRDKIKAVCLSPGSVYNGQSDSLKQNLENRIPIGRLARKDEYNGAIKFLCSSDSDYMQGCNLIADGGRNIW